MMLIIVGDVSEQIVLWKYLLGTINIMSKSFDMKLVLVPILGSGVTVDKIYKRSKNKEALVERMKEICESALFYFGQKNVDDITYNATKNEIVIKCSNNEKMVLLEQIKESDNTSTVFQKVLENFVVNFGEGGADGWMEGDIILVDTLELYLLYKEFTMTFSNGDSYCYSTDINNGEQSVPKSGQIGGCKDTQYYLQRYHKYKRQIK